MKKTVLFIILFLVTGMVMAQDVIVKKDGSIIQSKVMEINETEIKYKKWTNVKGPIYAISRSEVMSINYQNGEVESFVIIDEEELDEEVGSFQGRMEYKGRPTCLIINGQKLSDEEIRTCFGKKGYKEYLLAQSKLQVGNTFGTIGLVLLVPAMGGLIYGISENSTIAYTISTISSAISIPSIIVDIALSCAGKNGMLSLVDNYNNRNKNKQSASLQVFPSIINNQFGGAAGVTFSLSF